MTKVTAAAVVTLVSLLGACGEATTGATESETPTTEGESPTEASERSPSKEKSPSKKASSPPDRKGDQVLTGTVGEAEDPEAFTITLTDSSGEQVTSLPAGEYQVEVTDLASIHNFHLAGPGVDETTTVPGTGEVTWTVTLEPGSYTFICDPHPDMVGEVKVT